MSSATESMSIGKYEYTYGAGSAPNRKIKFYGNGKDSVWGIVQGLVKGEWQEINKIEEVNMIKEGASTAEKIRIMLEARESRLSPQYPSDQSFDQLPYEERVKTIKSLEPMGSYRIEIINNIGRNPFFERVEKLNFFDPS